MNRARRLNRLRLILLIAIGLVFLKTFLAILFEYRWYFPPDFDASAFLSGRRRTFTGYYPVAFYAHIIAGPIAVLLGAALMFTGLRRRFFALHGIVGKIQTGIVILLIVPSGLAMATTASTGSMAAWGFGMLSAATAFCMTMVVITARAKNIASHQDWAARCLILLSSPLMLRLISGASIASGFESELLYRLNAWISWMTPLILYELFRGRMGSGINFVSSGVSCRVFAVTAHLQRRQHERSKSMAPIRNREL